MKGQGPGRGPQNLRRKIKKKAPDEIKPHWIDLGSVIPSSRESVRTTAGDSPEVDHD